jgi:hypothetical protein
MVVDDEAANGHQHRQHFCVGNSNSGTDAIDVARDLQGQSNQRPGPRERLARRCNTGEPAGAFVTAPKTGSTGLHSAPCTISKPPTGDFAKMREVY